VALRLYLPEHWAGDLARCAEVGVPFDECCYRPKWQLALEELDRVQAAGVQFGLALADAAYGMCREFRQGLTTRGLRWAVGVPATQQVYPADVGLVPPVPPEQRGRGRPRRRAIPATPSVAAAAMIDHLGPHPFRRVRWRLGTKGPLVEEFAAVRVRVADGATFGRGQRLPGDAAWLVCERRTTGERKYYLTNHPARASLRTLARAIKARWVCEQAHQQLKEELGLDHFEGRSWTGLHHHALLTMIAFAFLQHDRLTHLESRPQITPRRRGKNPGGARAAARAQPPGHPPPDARGAAAGPALSPLRHAYPAAA
jgi:SRSO17 transposase